MRSDDSTNLSTLKSREKNQKKNMKTNCMIVEWVIFHSFAQLLAKFEKERY